MELNYNLLIDTDAYKPSHFLQLPPNTTGIFQYLESRGGRYANTLFGGLQPILHTLQRGFTAADLEEAKDFWANVGEPFNYEGFKHILNKHGGKPPVRIRAVAEGSLIPTHNALLTCESTDPEVCWIGGYLETMLMRVWYPITVATQSYHIKQIIKGYLERTADNWEQSLPWKLHDFGSRGVSSAESAAIGGMAHLFVFQGSDTGNGIRYANKFYNCKSSGNSIPAAEHFTITTWGKEREVDAFRNMLKQFAKPGAILAVVSDSYDLWNAIDFIWGQQLKKEIQDSGATIVIRPDSGNPPDVVLKASKLIDTRFGCTINSKGFKLFNNVRIIQGDGVNEDSIREILEVCTRAGYSADNYTFGMGGALLQKVDRDTQKFAFKCSQATVDGKSVDVFKDPVTDPGKRSKSGKLDLQFFNGQYQTVRAPANYGSLLLPVYEDGKILKEYTLSNVRDRANEGIQR